MLLKYIILLTITLSALLIKSIDALTFTGNTAFGLFAALAIPLDLPHRSVFVSFNFEANYNGPGNAKEIIPGPLTRFIPEDEKDKEQGRNENSDLENNVKNETQSDIGEDTDSPKTRKRKSLLSRASFYQILIDKFTHAGYFGEPCLLKLICESNAYQIGNHNGALGTLFHVLFSPTTSSPEGLHYAYYEAELNGRDARCDMYDDKCPKSILDLISTLVFDQSEYNNSK